MKAVVIAGGEGSRLRPLTSRRPKPLVPVVGTSILEHILYWLREQGITEIIITLQYLGSEIRNRFGDGQEYGVDIEYVIEDSSLGTAGSVGNARHLLDETFLVVGGDTLTDMDLSKAVSQHHKRVAKATVILYRVPNPLEYGLVVTESDGRIVRFVEKPSWSDVVSDQANTGIYILEPTVFDYIKPGKNLDWAHDVFPRMLRKDETLSGVVGKGYWCDIGTQQSYLQANWDALTGKVRCQIRGTKKDNVWFGEGVEVADDVQLKGPIFIGDEAKIKSGVFLNGPVVVDNYSVIDADTKVSNTIIWPRSYIGEKSRLRQSIICRSVVIKDNCLIEDDAIIGERCVIGEGAHIASGVKIWPHKEVEPGARVMESVIWTGERKRRLFAPAGVTGLVNVELTPEFCARLGSALGASLPRGSSVAITRDMAPSSRMIKRALIAGMMSAGASVIDLSTLPVPVTQFATKYSECLAGLHILEAASDPRNADIRFFDPEGLYYDRRAQQKLENLFFREDFRRVAFYEMGRIKYADRLADYENRLLEDIDQEAIAKARLRILVDFNFGSSSEVLANLLNELKVTVINLHSGISSSKRLETSEQESASITRTVGADFGCILGPAGERLTLIDDTGVVLSNQQTLGILSKYVLEQSKNVIVGPVGAPFWLSQGIDNAGGQYVPTKVTPQAISSVAIETEAELASDGKGRFIWSKQPGAYDAIYTVIRLLELRAKSNLALSTIRKQFPKATYITASEYCPWELRGKVMRLLVEQHQGRSIDVSEGIKVHVPDGYVLVVPDYDEPKYNVIVSVTEPHEASQLLTAYTTMVRQAQSGENGSLINLDSLKVLERY